jgi:cytochrome c oxidase subunit 2
MPIVVVAKSPEDYAAWVKDTKAKMPPAPDIVALPQQAPGGTPPAAPAQVATAAAAAAPADANKKWTLDELKSKGATLYGTTCAACHQPTGKGMPPAFPALDGSKVATGPKAGHIAVVLKGRPGTAMASFAQQSDADLAAIITYERNSWSNKTGEAIQPAEIAAARK